MKRFFNNCIIIDSRLFLKIYHLSGKRFLDWFFYIITKIADGWVYGLLTAAYLFVKTAEAIRFLPALLSAYVIENALYYLIKKNVKRIRPFNKLEGITSLVIPPDEFSFPSGHTAAAAVFSVLCASLFPLVAPYLFIYTVLVGFSRIYNGVHYPGDIFAGAGLGIFSAKMGLLLF